MTEQQQPTAPRTSTGDKFCAYDKTLLRFIGKPGSRAQASDAKQSAPEGHDVVIRKV